MTTKPTQISKWYADMTSRLPGAIEVEIPGVSLARWIIPNEKLPIWMLKKAQQDGKLKFKADVEFSGRPWETDFEVVGWSNFKKYE